MGINTERDIQANLQIGPTDQGMVRLFIEADGIEIPMDFDPEEAEEIADEIVLRYKPPLPSKADLTAWDPEARVNGARHPLQISGSSSCAAPVRFCPRAPYARFPHHRHRR